MKKIALSLLAFAFMFAASAQSKTKHATVRELLKASGSGNLAVQVAGSLFGQMKEAYPQVDTMVWHEMKKEMKAEEVEDMLVPIYEKHFSQDELEGLIAFYKSPLGKKLLAAMPAVMQESMQVGREWGQQLAKRVFERLKEKGINVE